MQYTLIVFTEVDRYDYIVNPGLEFISNGSFYGGDA